MNYINEMIAALQSSGLLVDDLIFDGELHRVPTIAKPSNKNGWYVAFVEGTSVLFGDWLTGIEKVWSVQSIKTTREGIIANKKAKLIYKQEKLKKQQKSAEDCQKIWFMSVEAM